MGCPLIDKEKTTRGSHSFTKYTNNINKGLKIDHNIL